VATPPRPANPTPRRFIRPGEGVGSASSSAMHSVNCEPGQPRLASSSMPAPAAARSSPSPPSRAPWQAEAPIQPAVVSHRLVAPLAVHARNGCMRAVAGAFSSSTSSSPALTSASDDDDDFGPHPAYPGGRARAGGIGEAALADGPRRRRRPRRRWSPPLDVRTGALDAVGFFPPSPDSDVPPVGVVASVPGRNGDGTEVVAAGVRADFAAAASPSAASRAADLDAAAGENLASPFKRCRVG